jgi:hypothetical protein
MLDCWKANPLERPSFMELAQRFILMIMPVSQLNNLSHEKFDGASVYQPGATQTHFAYVTDVNYSFP